MLKTLDRIQNLQKPTETTYYANKYFNARATAGQATTTTKHVFFPDGTPVASIEDDGTSVSVQYIHTDHLGGTSVVTDSSGNVVQTLDYYP